MLIRTPKNPLIIDLGKGIRLLDLIKKRKGGRPSFFSPIKSLISVARFAQLHRARRHTTPARTCEPRHEILPDTPRLPLRRSA